MLLEKIISGEITVTELTSKTLKDEILSLMNGVKTVVVTATKKVMKFVSKLSTGKQTIDLVAFYKVGKKDQPLYIWPNFQKVLDEATEHGGVASVEIDETFFQYQNTESVTDNDAIAELSESIIDLGTVEGRLEARKRLGILACFLAKQPKAEAGDLLTNGYANVIGWFKTSSGSVFSLYAGWRSDVREWRCFGHGLSRPWGADHRFWSRNESK